MPGLENRFILANVLETTCDLSAKLVILNLSYNRLKAIFREIAGEEQYVQISKSVIEKAYGMTAEDGICCVVATDEMDHEKGVLSPLGTKAVWNTHYWHVSDEIIWNMGPVTGLGMEPDLIDFADTPFSQIWVLSKQRTIRQKTDFPAAADLSEQKKAEIAGSVWDIKPESQPGYKDPLPSELPTRLISLYSDKGDLVLDPFAGHCLTALVCRSLGRNFPCFANDATSFDIRT